MAIDFSKWNEDFGGEKALEDLKKAAQNTGDYSEVPDGEYFCHLDKLELGESKKGAPMIKAQFRILEGDHKKQCIFYNQVFTRGFPQHKGLEFLRSLNIFDQDEVDFDGNFENFNDLLLDMAEESETLKFYIRKSKDGDFTRLDVLDAF